MKLTRFAVIVLERPCPCRDEIPSSFVSERGVTVTVIRIRDAGVPIEDRGGIILRLDAGGSLQAVVAAEVVGAPMCLDRDHCPVVPSVQRVEAEAAIEEFADSLAVLLQCRRSIRSMNVCVSLEAEGSEDLGPQRHTSPASVAAPTRPRVISAGNFPHLRPLLADRQEGVRLLAAAVSDENITGRAREIYRLFESAFGKGIEAAATPLQQFLHSTPSPAMTFRKKEINQWVAKRGAQMHGDRSVGVAHDLVGILPRMEWAAFDVLLNKKTWGTSDWDRRDGHSLESGVSRTGAVLRFADVSGPTEVHHTETDQYGAYIRIAEPTLTLPFDDINDADQAWSYTPIVSAVGAADDSL